MKEYYLQRLHWIFHYKSKKFFYCLAKTLCMIVGVPIYAVSFVMEMLFTGINMIFSWIPVLNVVMTVICKAFVWLFGSTFYICILPDLKEYREATKKEVDYEVQDESVLAEPVDGESVNCKTTDSPQPTEEAQATDETPETPAE